MKEKENKGWKALLAIALAVGAVASLTGCADEARQERLIIRKAQIEQECIEQRSEWFSKCEFEGHSYILYQTKLSGGVGASITHDPDCPCQKGGTR